MGRRRQLRLETTSNEETVEGRHSGPRPHQQPGGADIGWRAVRALCRRPRHHLAEKLDAFPDTGTYNPSDFGNELNAVDVNFDGFLDIAEFGTVYTFGSSQRSPTAVWLNDGTGRFSLARWSDPMQSSGSGGCTLHQAYFLKTPDPRAFNLVLGSCSHAYMTRTVTPEFPLTFTR